MRRPAQVDFCRRNKPGPRPSEKDGVRRKGVEWARREGKDKDQAKPRQNRRPPTGEALMKRMLRDVESDSRKLKHLHKIFKNLENAVGDVAQLVRCQGLPIVLRAMMDCRSDPTVVSSGCFLLDSVLAPNVPEVVAEGGGLGDNYKRIMLEGKVFEVVLEGMKAHPQNETVNVEACKVLKNLTIGDDAELTLQCKNLVLANGGISVILDTVQRHLSNPFVLNKAFQSIINFTHSCYENQAAVGERGIDLILHGMNLHSSNADVQHYGCYALVVLSCPSSERRKGEEGDLKQLVTSKGVVDILLRAMRNFPGDSELQAVGCTGLDHFCSRSSTDFKLEVVEKGAMDLVLAAVQAHVMEKSLLLASCDVLDRFICRDERDVVTVNEELGRLFVAKGGSEALLSAVEVHSGDSQLFSTCYRILQSLPNNVVSWLERNHLQQYVKNFLSNGYDDMMVISELIEDDIAKMEITATGHGKKILLLARQLRALYEAKRQEEEDQCFVQRLEEICRLNRKLNIVPSRIPSEMICPITHELMLDPVILVDGYSYEKVAVVRWMSKHDTSPVSGQRLMHTECIPNIRLRNVIEEFRQRNMFVSDTAPEQRKNTECPPEST